MEAKEFKNMKQAKGTRANFEGIKSMEELSNQFVQLPELQIILKMITKQFIDQINYIEKTNKLNNLQVT